MINIWYRALNLTLSRYALRDVTVFRTFLDPTFDALLDDSGQEHYLYDMMDFIIPRRAFPYLLVLSSAVNLVTEATIIPADPSKDILWPYYTFETVDFTPPVLNITQYSPPSEGYLFFAPDGATPYQIAPLIMDVSGELVWNGPLEHAFNFGVYEYNGESVLAWWNGTLFPEPIGRGE